MSFVLGHSTLPLGGNITKLNAILLANPRGIERNLGYHSGRLNHGYKILLLLRLPNPSQIDFDGTTLRSGGRLGLPEVTPSADAKRLRVHDKILAERGPSEYAVMKATALRNVQVKGPERLVKIRPEVGHDQEMSPNKQYPMGGGFLQWKLKRPGMQFLFAAQVDAKGVAHIPGAQLALNSGNFSADYSARAKLQTYLQNA